MSIRALTAIGAVVAFTTGSAVAVSVAAADVPGIGAAAVRPGASASLGARPTVVTLDGVGGVLPGMTAAQVASIWRTPVRLGLDAGSPGCRTAKISAGGVRGYALFENGRLGAVWFDRGVRTPSGITIGSTVPQLVRAYGYRLQAEPHKYQLGAQYFFLTRKQSPRWRMRFDASAAARVTQIGFGARAVGYVEGCS